MSEFITISSMFFGAVINQMVSRSAFYVELSSDWCIVVINDLAKYCLKLPLETGAKLSLSGTCEIRELSGKCMGMSGNFVCA